MEKCSRVLSAAVVVVMLLGLGCQQPPHAEDRKHERGELPGQRQTEAASSSAPAVAFQPRKLPFQEAYLERLKLPPGFRVNVFARGLTNPRMMAVSPEGVVYVILPDAGRVVALRDDNGDGVAESPRTIISGLDEVHGITWHRGVLYVATPTTVYQARMDTASGQGVAAPRAIIRNLPTGGRHPNRTLAFGPDGMLYVSVGSACDACREPNPEHATMLVADPETWQRRIFARGLRNTIGFDWHPETRQLWGMDHGSDWRGADIPPEELNRIEAGGHYGWPWCFGAAQVDRMTADRPPDGQSPAEFCTTTRPAVMTYQAHSSPLAFVFYTGSMFPQAYRDSAFLALRGSWNRKPAVGYKVVVVEFEGGRPVGFRDFLTGFLTEGGQAQFARIAGLAVARDGALLISDDQNGVIYRVSYAAP